jgi:hypothetical protein
MHLGESIRPERFDELMPKAFGVSWGAAFGSTSRVLGHTQHYARQLESVVARWDASDFGMMQPVAPCPMRGWGMFSLELITLVGQKELDLLGESSGASTARGGSDWAQNRGAGDTV